MVLKIIAIARMVVAGAAFEGMHRDVNDGRGAALSLHILWSGDGAGAIRLWRMANGELRRGGSERAKEESCPADSCWECWAWSCCIWR